MANSAMAVDLAEKKEQVTSKILFHFFSSESTPVHKIFKLDLNRQFYDPESSSCPKYLCRTEATPSPALSPSPSSSRCNSGSKTKKRKIGAIFKFNRHLRLMEALNSNARLLPPLLPAPYMRLEFFGSEGGLPSDMAMAALGSKIYLIGGHRYIGNNYKYPLPRDVYVIDTDNSNSNSPPAIVKMSSQLNSGKRHPIACTINGKIYVMPHSFTRIGYSGINFECYDPKSNSWTPLPDPPFVGRYIREYRPRVFLGDLIDSHIVFPGNPFRVERHAVVGTNLLISIEYGGVYTFDTTRPQRGWKKIILSLSPCNVRLNFLPFCSHTSFEMLRGQGLIFSQLPLTESSKLLLDFLKRSYNIRKEDFYVCSFDDLDALSDPRSEIVKISIRPVTGISTNERWGKFVRYHSLTQATRIEDGLVLFANFGCEHPKGKLSFCYCFDVFRIERILNSKGEEEDHQYDYRARCISSSLFRTQTQSHTELTLCTSSFLFKDGTFSS